MKECLYGLFLVLFLSSCARVGSPVGGKRDSLAPNFLRSNIDSSRVNVPTSQKELRLYFDEYILLKDINKNLVISPEISPIKKIIPSHLGNKYISIQWTDSLKANTTYNFNFGNAITDLNEGNVLPYFNYAFSTGKYLDSIYISGEVLDGMRMRPKDNESVSLDKNMRIIGLYRETQKVNYNKKPDYITKVDADGYYELNHLKEGKYRILAFNDENQNSVFDAGAESVAFRSEAIDLQKHISGLKMRLFPSKKKVRYVESKPIAGGVLLLFEGNPETVSVSSEHEKLKAYKVQHHPKSDSVSMWFDAVKQNIGITSGESLKFNFKADTLKGTASIFYKHNSKNEFVLKNELGATIPPNRDFVITSNYPVISLDTAKWELKEDSLKSIRFSAKIQENYPMKIRISAKFLPGKKYQLTLPKETAASYYAAVPKGYQFNFEIDKEENYGSVVFNFINKPSAKFWVQLLDEQYKIQYSRHTDAAKVIFTELKPARYIARVLVDSNGNGSWDEVDFANKTHAEPVCLFDKIIEVKQLWEIVEEWNLSDSTTIPVDYSLMVKP